MSFFFHSLVRTFLAERAIHLVSNEIRHEIDARNAGLRHHKQVDFALLFSGKSERNAFFDLCNKTSVTQGNGITFHQTVVHENSLVFVDFASNPAQITETVLDVFQPKRVISTGFAKSLHASGKNRLFVPTRIVASQSATCLDIWNPSLLAGPSSENHFHEKDNFCSGILCSGRPTQVILEKYDPFAVDSSTYFVVDTCRRRNIPCFPLQMIVSEYDPKSEISGRHGFARKFGLFLNKTWNNPKYALNSFSHQINHLESGDVLAKAIMKLFFQNISSESKDVNV